MAKPFNSLGNFKGLESFLQKCNLNIYDVKTNYYKM